MDYLKLRHQMNLNGTHKGEFESCPKCKKLIAEREERIKNL